MRVLGVDEAGRGPILGPMAVAVVAVDEAGARSLLAAGVADSKSFGVGPDARARRAELASVIHQGALGAELTLVSVEEIDRHTYQGLLNALERKVVRQLLRKLAATRDHKLKALLSGAGPRRVIAKAAGTAGRLPWRRAPSPPP